VGRWLGLVGQDGVWQVGISSGQLRPHNGLFDQLVAAGKNVFNNNKSGSGGYGLDTLNAYQDHHFDHGWNESWWSAMRERFVEARDKDIIEIVGVWGTVWMEGDRRAACQDGSSYTCRWDVSPWNARNNRGGPYDLPGCGKDAFYTLADPDGPVYTPGAPYPADADMHTRGQWRQEEYLHRLATLAAEFPNVAISLVWEASDLSTHQWGDCGTTIEKVLAWHAHRRAYIQSLSPHTLVATGTDEYKAHHFSGMDFLTTEAGAVYNLPAFIAAPPALPVVYTGWSAYNAAGDACAKDCSAADFAYVRGQIRDGWAAGIQVGSPFWEYKDEDTYVVHLDPYLVQLRALVDGVATWEDEPGAEITAGSLPAP